MESRKPIRQYSADYFIVFRSTLDELKKHRDILQEEAKRESEAGLTHQKYIILFDLTSRLEKALQQSDKLTEVELTLALLTCISQVLTKENVVTLYTARPSLRSDVNYYARLATHAAALGTLFLAPVSILPATMMAIGEEYAGNKIRKAVGLKIERPESARLVEKLVIQLEDISNTLILSDKSVSPQIAAQAAQSLELLSISFLSTTQSTASPVEETKSAPASAQPDSERDSLAIVVRKPK